MRFLPQTSKEYPLRIFIYWLIIWAILFLVSTLKMLPKISTNGYVVRKDVCLEEASSGRFDEYTECVEYGDPYYIPVGKELLNNFKNYGIFSFVIVISTGLFLMFGKRIEEKQSNNDI